VIVGSAGGFTVDPQRLLLAAEEPASEQPQHIRERAVRAWILAAAHREQIGQGAEKRLGGQASPATWGADLNPPRPSWTGLAATGLDAPPRSRARGSAQALPRCRGCRACAAAASVPVSEGNEQAGVRCRGRAMRRVPSATRSGPATPAHLHRRLGELSKAISAGTRWGRPCPVIETGFRIACRR
jgi:hypothetical protein